MPNDSESEDEEEHIEEKASIPKMMKLPYSCEESDYDSSSDEDDDSGHGDGHGSPIPDDANSKKFRYLSYMFCLLILIALLVIIMQHSIFVGGYGLFGSWFSGEIQSRLSYFGNQFIALCLQYVPEGSQFLCG